MRGSLYLAAMDEHALPDEILLEGMRFYGYHGVHPEEQRLGQRFVVDVALTVDLQAAGESDNLAETVSYSAAYTEIRRIVEGPPRKLIEAVAEDIASALLALDGRVQRVQVRVAKPEAPVKGSVLDAVAVRIMRHREAGETRERVATRGAGLTNLGSSERYVKCCLQLARTQTAKGCYKHQPG